MRAIKRYYTEIAEKKAAYYKKIADKALAHSQKIIKIMEEQEEEEKMTKLEHLIKITIDPWADLPRIPRGFDKWDAYQREIERREINHNEFLAIFKKTVPEENGK